MQVERTIRRYIGLSTETKPRIGDQIEGAVATAVDLPPGTTFYETDTGRTWIYERNNWTQRLDSANHTNLADQPDLHLECLRQLLHETQSLRQLAELLVQTILTKP